MINLDESNRNKQNVNQKVKCLQSRTVLLLHDCYSYRVNEKELKEIFNTDFKEYIRK